LKDKSISKERPRAQLEADVEEFLKKGGKIDYIDTGVSGVKPKQSPMKKPAKKYRVHHILLSRRARSV